MRDQFAAERARLLFGSYRRGDANDPAAYLATIAAVLSEYPEETIRYVTDPRTGIASNPKRDPRTGRAWTGLPDPGDIRWACEAHYGPTKRAIEREAQERRTIEERNRVNSEREKPTKTYEQMVADCRARGLMIGPRDPKKHQVDINTLLKETGVSREEFDALPNAPDFRWK